ncbi:MAG TPA: ribonuclease HI family protein [Actinomycetota bacterium]|nr:ribonuclease HI family protein [Actinomycetota bacterium]
MHKLWTDGGARGNPGPGGIGVVLLDPQGNVVKEIDKGIGWATNNVAEYTGLIEGLELALEEGVEHIHVHMDSKLVVEQVRGRWRVKHAGLKPLHARAVELSRKFQKVLFTAVPREQNSRADELMNQGIDRWLAENPGATAPEPDEQTLF